MLYKNKIINIKKNIKKKKLYIKKEIKNKILKSIIQNNNVKPVIKSSVLYKLIRLKYIWNITKQNNLCVYSGKSKGVFTKYKMSRHFIKEVFSKNELQNNKIINW